jgi:hypothetical protein
VFLDDDPEDAWDEGDPRPVKLGILVRLLLSVTLERAVTGHNHPRVVARIAFGIWQSQVLTQTQEPHETPILDALRSAFAHLNTLEGP